MDKNPSKAVSINWAVINSGDGDKVDSALKNMVLAMTELNRDDEAIEAIKSFRHLCSPDAQESLDNILVESYKRSGRVEEQIDLLQSKVKRIEEATSIDGNRTKIQTTCEQEYSRLLGNLAWLDLQKDDYESANDKYRKALSFKEDKNMRCNLAVCLMYMGNMNEAMLQLDMVTSSNRSQDTDDESYAMSYKRAIQVKHEIEIEKMYPTGDKISFSLFLSRKRQLDLAADLSSSPLYPIHPLPLPLLVGQYTTPQYSNADDSPYFRAKDIQFRDPSKAISLFWAAINSRDRVTSALKDMALVMMKLNRSDEAIEAIKSFRQLCPPNAQKSFDDILNELYTISGRVTEMEIPYDVWHTILEVGVKNSFCHKDLCNISETSRLFRHMTEDLRLWQSLAQHSSSFRDRLISVGYGDAFKKLTELNKQHEDVSKNLKTREVETKAANDIFMDEGGVRLGVHLSSLQVTVVQLKEKLNHIQEAIRRQQNLTSKLEAKLDHLKRGGRGGRAL